ncbi:MAG: hypothetical protein KC422_24995 [Trueperaceae bacterium]|nr:hypothetical protein [Trueperaceae bacterium]
MPGDTKPHKARQAKKAKLKPGDIKDITSVLWSAIVRLEQHLVAVTESDTDTNELCKLTHAMSQAASTYIKALEVGEYEARLTELEKAYELEKENKAA